MSRPLRSSSDAVGGYTRLERTVLTALAADLRDTVPDLARQIAASRPSRRRNTGFGLFTDLVVQAPAPLSGPTGDFGAVHAMVSSLRDPIAFTARLQNGRLIGLMGDSYGQDTRQIDFATAPFAQVFTLDASGRSIPVPVQTETPLPPRPGEEGRRAATTGWEGPQRPAPAAQNTPRPQTPVRPAPVQARRQAPTPTQPPAPVITDPFVPMLVGWAVIAVIALVAIVAFDVPWPFVLIAAFWLSASLRKPKARAALQRGVDEYQKARAAQRG